MCAINSQVICLHLSAVNIFGCMVVHSLTSTQLDELLTLYIAKKSMVEASIGVQ